MLVETILAVSGRLVFQWRHTGWSPGTKTIQLLVHMFPGDQCTRFAISKMTTIKACMHSLSLLATKNATEANVRFRLAYERGTVPDQSTNGRSHRVTQPSIMAKLRHD
jgi:hypothetical protein